MKKTFIIISIIFIIPLILFANNSKNNNLELGIKYLKLGNTYRESKEFGLSKEYLDKGTQLIKKSKNYYWDAASDEFYGYLYQDMSEKYTDASYLKLARKYMNNAFIKYSKIIKQKDGSQVATSMILKNIDKMLGTYSEIEYPDQNERNIKKNEFEYINKGINFLAQNEPENAIDEFEKALEINPESELANNLLNFTTNQFDSGKSKSNKPTMKGLKPNKQKRCPNILNDKVYISIEEAMSENPLNIYKIDLSNQDLKTIPSDLFNFKNLQYLNLSGNDISLLPDEICSLSFLKELNLTSNNISKLPFCIIELKCLTTLYLRGNDISLNELMRLKDKKPELQLILDNDR